MNQTVDPALQSGRAAIARYAWREAFDLLTVADASTSLDPEDLETLAQAAWWTGRLDACIEARERAYRGYLDQTNLRRAALMALGLELEAAASTFDRLGAVPDARRAGALRRPGAATVGARASPGRLIRTFMFTDIARSTPLVEVIGDEAWEDLVAWHDQTLRSLFAAHGGEEIDHAGDGFFVAFETGSQAIECAVAIQRALADHRRSQGFSPQIRVGLHAAPATHRGREYRGKGVHVAARIGALAEAGEILASQDTLAAVSDRFRVSPPRSVTLKGISEPVEVMSIEWQ